MVSSEQEAMREGLEGDVARSFMPPPWPTRVCLSLDDSDIYESKDAK